jgi:GNAT superfamily N-acetyltransferase
MSEANVKIRDRSEQDIPALAEILRRVHAVDGYPVEGVSDPVGWLHSDNLIGAWVTVSDHLVTGHIWLTRPTEEDAAAQLWKRSPHGQSAPIAVLGRLFVDPDSRIRGAGRSLTQTATDEARSMGYQTVLDVMAKDKSAIKLYESLGWQRTGTITHQFGHGKAEPAFAYIAPPD